MKAQVREAMRVNKRKAGGFTLIELITVIGILAIMSLFIFQEFGGASDDAKYGVAQTVLLKNFPMAISRVYGRTGTCLNLTAINLQDRGMNPQTPWGEVWTVAAATEDRVTITYPMNSATNATDMETALRRLGVTSGLFEANASVTAAGNNVAVIYECSANLG